MLRKRNIIYGRRKSSSEQYRLFIETRKMFENPEINECLNRVGFMYNFGIVVSAQRRLRSEVIANVKRVQRRPSVECSASRKDDNTTIWNGIGPSEHAYITCRLQAVGRYRRLPICEYCACTMFDIAEHASKARDAPHCWLDVRWLTRMRPLFVSGTFRSPAPPIIMKPRNGVFMLIIQFSNHPTNTTRRGTYLPPPTLYTPTVSPATLKSNESLLSDPTFHYHSPTNKAPT